MATTISGLQGKTIYRNSSYAPTRGRNNPAGYLQRELSKQGLVNANNNATPNSNPNGGNVGVFGGVSRVGGDGESDTRSGVAAGALKTTGAVGTSQGQGNGLVTATPGLTTPETPKAQISAIGEIKLPYNFNSTANILSEQQAAQQALLEIKKQRDANQLDYLRQSAMTQDEFDDTMDTSKNVAASRGLSFASAHGKDVSQNYNRFSDMMQQLAADAAAKENSAVESQNIVTTGLNAKLQQELAAQGFEAMEKGGQWVVTKKPTPTAKPSAKPKPAAKKPAAKPKPKNTKNNSKSGSVGIYKPKAKGKTVKVKDKKNTGITFGSVAENPPRTIAK